MAAIEKDQLPRVARELVPHTSERIEDAALQLFYERGFKSTTMREIALACGLTPGALYNHFVSKDELLGTLIVDVHRRLAEWLDAAVESSGDDPVEQLTAYCRAHALLHATYAIEARVANREIGALTPEPLEEVVAIRRRATEQLRTILRRGHEAGVFDVPNIEALSNLMSTMAISIASWYRSDGELGREEMADLDAEIALRMVTARPGGDPR